MSRAAPQPVCFEPLLVPKPWGGRRLETLLGRPLPAGARIGESWELADLDAGRTRVRAGPLAGATPGDLIAEWGVDLLGPALPALTALPLLIKFLDATENLSVQTHPRPQAGDAAGPPVKHECWYVLHADPGACLYIGLRAGVGPDAVAGANGTRALVGLLRAWTPRTGECYFLPSGTLHALGAGVVVAEVQTPSDVTYRAYDWDRVDAAGRPRAMHLGAALENIDYNVTPGDIHRPAAVQQIALARATRLVACPAFELVRWELFAGGAAPLHRGFLRAWIVLEGALKIGHALSARPLERGDVWLLPAAFGDCVVDAPAGATWLEALVPGRDPSRSST
jgi:mannose-6-phosphate isomerase